MSVIIGSARIDEHGHATGGQAGDQKQTSSPDYRGEVSMQNFYVHSKGWLIFRAKNPVHATELAKAMERACNNKNIGYDQYQRDGVVVHGTNAKSPTECDCSSLVRRCIIEATGKDPGNIRTITMPDMLPITGLFEDTITYTSGTTLYTGDILCTKTSGHTVIVVKGKSRTPEKLRAAKPTLRKSDTGDEVKMLQRDLKALGYLGKDGKPLKLDGDFGSNTEYALKNFQREHVYVTGVIKKKAEPLEVDGIYGSKSAASMKLAIKAVK